MVHRPAVHRQIQLLGFGTSLNSVAATLSQYSVHLLIFQLPERHHQENSVFDFTAIWHLFAVAKTTLGFYTKVASDRLSIAAPFTTESTPGRSSRTWAQTLFNGFTWRSGCAPMPLAFRDATFSAALPTILESHRDRTHWMQTCSSTSTSSSSMAINPQLATKPEEDPTLHSKPPSTNIVFTKYPSVMDSLCNHKEMATRWADSATPDCICTALRPYLGIKTWMEIRSRSTLPVLSWTSWRPTGRSGARSSRTLCVLYTILPADFHHPFMLRLSCHARQPGVILLPSRRNRCSSVGKICFTDAVL